MTIGWRHESGASGDRGESIRQVRLEKERASADAIAAQLREHGVKDLEVVRRDEGTSIRLHRYLTLSFCYRVSCDAVALTMETPRRYGLRKTLRYYKLDWEPDVPLLISPDRVASVALSWMSLIQDAEIRLGEKDTERKAFSEALRQGVRDAGFQADVVPGSGVVYLTSESDIRAKARAPAFQVHMAVTEDKDAHMFLKCRMPPGKIGVLAAKLNELVLEHGLRLM